MPTNQEISGILKQVYHLMQLAGENRFKTIAFDKASTLIKDMEEDINLYISEKRLTDIKGIGKSIAEDIFHSLQYPQSQRNDLNQ